MVRLPVVIVGLLLAQTVMPLAKAGPVQAPDAHFEAMCMKMDVLCKHLDLKFSHSGNVVEHETVWIHLVGRSAVSFWNRQARAGNIWRDRKVTDVAYYGRRTHKWLSIPVDPDCQACVRWTGAAGETERVYRLEWTRVSEWEKSDSWWSMERIIGQQDHEWLLVDVNSKDGPVVHAAVRTSGTNVEYSTRGTGSFRVLLEGRWVRSERPDFIVVSPMSSWAAVAHRYMQAHVQMLKGSPPLPLFHGSHSHVIAAAVQYLKDSGIRYDGTLDRGGFPNETISAIFHKRRTDCKGFATLLVALLRRSNVVANPVAINASGKAPLSLGVPDGWADHVMVYVPAIGRYIDATVIVGGNGKYTWQTSAAPYAGSVVLNLASGQFTTIPSEITAAGDDGDAGARSGVPSSGRRRLR